MTIEERCGNPHLADKTWLYQRSVVDGLTAQEIAQQAGATFQDTRSALMAAGIPHRIRNYYASTLGKRLTADTILTAIRQSTSIEQAAEALQVNPITLRKHAERKGLTWEAVKAAIGADLEPTRDMLAEAADEMTTPELAAHFGITVKRTRQLLAQHGLKARPNPFSMRASEVEEAVRRYEIDGESINVIAEALGYGPTSVYRALKRRGVATTPGRRKFNPDRGSLEELARTLTVRQMAEKFGVTKRTAYARLHEHDIALPGHDARSRSTDLALSGRRVRVACRGCETYVWRDRAVAAQGPSWCSKACQERNETP